jgi:hypothetical protein
MKISTLIGLVLVVASSSAYAWKQVSYDSVKSIYTVYCDSGGKVGREGTTQTVPFTQGCYLGGQRCYKSLDQAASYLCGPH